MVWVGAPNCQNLDNDRRCRIFHGGKLVHRWLDLRPRCVLDNPLPPRDGKWTCDEQVPYPRPAPPFRK